MARCHCGPPIYCGDVHHRIFWHTHAGTAADADFTAGAIARLIERLTASLPGLRLTATPLPGDFTDILDFSLLTGHLNGALASVRCLQAADPADVRSHVTVYCPDPSSPAASAARERLPHAAWGISLSGALSLTYTPANTAALWHETLHLLGAQDHYDPATFATNCDLGSCVMQYAPDARTIGESPFLCPATAAIVRRACA